MTLPAGGLLLAVSEDDDDGDEDGEEEAGALDPTMVMRPLTVCRSRPSTTGSEARRMSSGFRWLSGVRGGMGGGSDVTRRRLGDGGANRCDVRCGDCRTSIGLFCSSFCRVTLAYQAETSTGISSYFFMNGCSRSFLYFGRCL